MIPTNNPLLINGLINAGIDSNVAAGSVIITVPTESGIADDLNVAHQPIDLKNAKSNVGNSGFTMEEREKMTRLLDAGYIDTLRYFHPETEGLYTWWSYMKTVRERNIGWRIDYFIVSEILKDSLVHSETQPEVLGSDHCPILLELIELE